MAHETGVAEDAGVEQAVAQGAGAHALQGGVHAASVTSVTRVTRVRAARVARVGAASVARVLAAECDERVDAEEGAGGAVADELLESGVSVDVG